VNVQPLALTISLIGLFGSSSLLAQEKIESPESKNDSNTTTTIQTPTRVDSAPSSLLSVQEAPQTHNTVLEAFTPQPKGLTANEVAKRALASSRTIEVKNADLRSASAKVDAAMYQFIPKLLLKAQYLRLNKVKYTIGDGGYLVGARNPGLLHVGPLVDGNGNPVIDPNSGQPINTIYDSGNVPIGAQALTVSPSVDSYFLGASLSIPISDYVLKMSHSVSATKHNARAAEMNLKAERTKVEGDARIAFFNWARAIGQVAVTEKSIERVRARQKDVDAAYLAGLATKADVYRLRSLVANTEAGLEAATAFRELAAQQLAFIMNDSEPNYVLGEDVLNIKENRVIEPLKQLIKEAQARRYELLALDQYAQSLQRSRSATKVAQAPRLDGVANIEYANPNQRYLMSKGWRESWSVGVQITWAINEILNAGAMGNDIAAQRDSLIANRFNLANGVSLEVTSAYTDSRRAAAELNAAVRANDASQIAYEVVTEQFKAGKATTTEVIDAEGELVVSQLRFINAHLDCKVAHTKLARALGRDMTQMSY
jgi:outer membrane protein